MAVRMVRAGLAAGAAVLSLLAGCTGPGTPPSPPSSTASAGGTFPGGYFFAAAAELDTHPGRVRERIADFQAAWTRNLVDLIGEARPAGDIRADEDPAQIAFELNALLALANSAYVMFADLAALERARAGIQRRLLLPRSETSKAPDDRPRPATRTARPRR